MAGLILDTGALIALERERKRIREIVATAYADRLPIIAPAPVIAEWWRGRTDRRETILGMITVEPLDLDLVKRAGEALAAVHRRRVRADAKLTVDAVVMASAARRGHVVYTGDFDDLELFGGHFPAVKVLGV